MKNWKIEKLSKTDRDLYNAQVAVQMKGYEDNQVTYYKWQIADQRRKTKQRIRLMKELAKCGVIVKEATNGWAYKYGVTIPVHDIHDFRDLRNQLGERFVVDGKTVADDSDFFEVDSTKPSCDDYVKITMRPEAGNDSKFAGLAITYIAKLDPEDKCKIRVEKSEFVSRLLVCETS